MTLPQHQPPEIHSTQKHRRFIAGLAKGLFAQQPSRTTELMEGLTEAVHEGYRGAAADSGNKDCSRSEDREEEG